MPTKLSTAQEEDKHLERKKRLGPLSLTHGHSSLMDQGWAAGPSTALSWGWGREAINIHGDRRILLSGSPTLFPGSIRPPSLLEAFPVPREPGEGVLSSTAGQPERRDHQEMDGRRYVLVDSPGQIVGWEVGFTSHASP